MGYSVDRGSSVLLYVQSLTYPDPDYTSLVEWGGRRKFPTDERVELAPSRPALYEKA